MALFTVTTTSDNPLDGFTLREAIFLANINGEDDVITFDLPGLADTVTLSAGELNILDDVVIDGDLDNDGDADITIESIGNDRVFDITGNTPLSPTEVTFDGVIISNGSSTNLGGGILIRENSDVTLINSEVGASDADNGGAIANAGDLTIINSTLAGNTAGESGGAIYNVGDVRIENSTISDNDALADGGGIFNVDEGRVTILNSTLSGNEANTGGAIANFNGAVALVNSTVTGNKANTIGAGVANGDDLFVANSILAGNSVGSVFDDVSGGGILVTRGVNIFSEESAAGVGDLIETDLTQIFAAVDPLTGGGLLDDNGGATETVAINPEGVAVDAGENGFAVDPGGDLLPELGDTPLTTDQRGVAFPRIVDGDAVGGDRVDIGAFEIQNTPPTLILNEGITVTEGMDQVISDLDLDVTDPNNGPTQLIFELLSLPENGRLELSGTTLNLGDTFTQQDIIDGDLVYFHDDSQTTADSFTFSVTDPSGVGPQQQVFSITVDPENDAPELVVNSGFAAPEGGQLTISSSVLGVSDVDNTPDELTYELTSVPTNGILLRGGAPIGPNGTFTQDDLDKGLISYLHDGTETDADSFTVDLRDPDGEGFAVPVAIGIVPGNNPPFLAVNVGVPVVEEGTATIDATRLLATDPDNPDSEIIYTLIKAPTDGILKLADVQLLVGMTFTQENVSNGDLEYESRGEDDLDTFMFTVANPGGIATMANFTIGIETVNDTPELVTNLIQGVIEGTGVTLSNDVLRSTDNDNLISELTYTVTDAPENGTLFLNGVPLFNGATFTQLNIDEGAVTYVHDGSETLTDAFTFDIFDPDFDGLTDQVFDFTVIPVDDTPKVVTNNDLWLDENAGRLITSDLLKATDDDDGPGDVEFTLLTIPGHGEVRLDGKPLRPGDSFTQSDINNDLVRYVHDGSEEPVDGFTFRVANPEGTGFHDGTFEIHVRPVNDAPIIVSHDLLMLTEGGTTVVSPLVLEAFDADHPPEKVFFTLCTDPKYGQLFLDGKPIKLYTSFTQEDINEGRVTYVHDGSQEEHEHFTLLVTDPLGAGPGHITVNGWVAQANDGPELLVNNGLFTVTAGSDVIESSDLLAVDEESGPSDVRYFIRELPTNGRLTLNGVELEAGETFTQSDINSMNVSYVHDGSGTISDLFRVDVIDEDGLGPLNVPIFVAIGASNFAPTIITNTGIEVPRGDIEVINPTELAADDPDNADAEIIFTLATLPVNGAISRGETQLGLGQTFTQADLNAGLISYEHDGSATTADGFQVRVRDVDGGTDSLVQSVVIQVAGTPTPPPVQNTPPVARDDTFASSETSPVNGNLFADNGNGVDEDPDGNFIEVFSVLGNPSLVNTQIVLGSGATLFVSSNGTFTYDPSTRLNGVVPGDVGTDVFTYAIADADGALTGATATILLGSVQPPQPAPTEAILTIQPNVTGVAEGDDGSTINTFTVSRAGNISLPVTVDYTVSAGAGAEPAGGSDFATGGTYPSGSVNFAAGQTSALIVLPISGDMMPELDETYQVTLSNPIAAGGFATILGNTATGTILNDDGEFTLTLTNGNDKPKGTTSADVVTGMGGADKLRGDAGADIIFGGADGDKIRGDEDDDSLFGEDGDDKLDGGDGDDMLDGGAGEDRLRGRDGNDEVNGGADDDRIRGEDGDDTLFGDAGDDVIRGDDGDDSISGGDGMDSVRGGKGTDVINGGDGDDDLRGDHDNDFLIGGAGDDELNGGKGEDLLDGGAGDDELTGGKDADTFRFATGNELDTITDFDVDEDQLDFSLLGQLLADKDAFDALATQVGKDIRLEFDAIDDVLVIEDVELGELTDSNFIF